MLFILTKKEVKPFKGSYLTPLDFTLTKFQKLAGAVAQHYPTLTLVEYFKGAALSPRFAIMRRDIDRKPGRALLTARIEQELGIKQCISFYKYITKII